MAFTDIVEKGHRFSIEITPNNFEKSLLKLTDYAVEKGAAGISVTTHDSAGRDLTMPTTYQMVRLLTERYKPRILGGELEVIPHLKALNTSEDEMKMYIDELYGLGVKTGFFIQGDPNKEDGERIAGPYRNACQLAQEVKAYEQLRDYGGMEIGGAFYPEKLSELPYAKAKQELGFKFLIGQMCFDNDVVDEWNASANGVGVTIDRYPGVKPLTRERQLEAIPRKFGAAIPQCLRDAVLSSPANGVDYCAGQMADLWDRGYRNVQVFVTRDTPLAELLDRLEVSRA